MAEHTLGERSAPSSPVLLADQNLAPQHICPAPSVCQGLQSGLTLGTTHRHKTDKLLLTLCPRAREKQ